MAMKIEEQTPTQKQLLYESIKPLQKQGAPIIIVAAVGESEVIANACKENGIIVSVICDNILGKSKTPFCGIEVVHTPSLPNRFPAARFIIVSQHIQDCVEQLISLGYNEFYSPLELLDSYDLEKNTHSMSNSYLQARISVCRKSHEAYLGDEQKIYMRSIDLMITTKCSLKCESCSNLMQYFESPQNYDYQSILDSLKIISENVDDIAEFRLIGGEPLMNKGWDQIVAGISEKYPDREVFIYTNGTIAPKDDKLEHLRGKKVNFIISEYGHLSRNLHKLHEQLKKFNIHFVSKKADYWVDCSNIRHHKRTSSQLKEVFKQCCVKYIYTLLDGKLYRCPFIANAAALNAIPDNPANYVDLFSKTQNINNEIRRLVKVAKFFPACDFCDGRPYDGTSNLGYDGKGMIEAGIQTAKPLPYKKYALPEEKISSSKSSEALST
jgi:hypothetical protein